MEIKSSLGRCIIYILKYQIQLQIQKIAYNKQTLDMYGYTLQAHLDLQLLLEFMLLHGVSIEICENIPLAFNISFKPHC